MTNNSAYIFGSRKIRSTATRDEFILELCRGKKVLHIGACDAPYTEEKIQQGNFLYGKIDSVCSSQVGIDLDDKAISQISKMDYPRSEVVKYDMNLDGKPEFIKGVDILIMGEVIEHIMNLEVCLKNIKQFIGPETKLVISTPNFLTFSKIIYSLLGKEYQHPDHNVVFTHKTLSTLLSKTGYKVVDYRFTFLNNHTGTVLASIDKFVAKFFPVFSSTLLFIAEDDCR